MYFTLSCMWVLETLLDKTFHCFQFILSAYKVIQVAQKNVSLWC